MRRDDHLIFEAFKNRGLSDQEYHKARKDALEGPGEELGNGPIKLQLMRDQKFDCYKSGTVQEVEFVKGTIFNCEDAQSDYYHCETKEYGTIAVFPEGMKRLSGEENAEGPVKIVHASAQDIKNKPQSGPVKIDWNAEDAEDKSLQSNGAMHDITAIQKVCINTLKKHGFQLNKVSNAHAEQEGGPVVYMSRKQGPMHNIVEISPMGLINGEPYKEYFAELKANAEETEGPVKIVHASAQDIKNKPQSGPVKIDWNA